MKSFFGKGMAAGYRAGRQHIRKLNAANRKISAVGLTDKSRAIAATDKGTVPDPAQKTFNG